MNSYTKKKLVSLKSQLPDSLSNVYVASLSLTSAQVLQLNSTPQTVVAAPGEGKYIEVLSASAIIETYGGTPYATRTELQLISSGAAAVATSTGFFNTMCLTSTVARISYFTNPSQSGTTTLLQMTPNTALSLTVVTGNPVNGNSDIKIKVLYRVVTI